MAKAINSPYYWTYEKCKEEADKYLILKDFRKKSPIVYWKITEMKWFELLKHIQRQNKKWSFEECEKEVKKYTTLKELQKNSNSAYRRIIKMKWFVLTKNLKKSEKWDYEKCKDVASLCSTKKEFNKLYSSAYSYAIKNNFLDDICSHMIPLGNTHNRMVYAYEFILNNDKFIYVGITCNEKRRKSEHLNENLYSSVNKFMIENNISEYTYIKISEYIPVKEAQLLESSTLEEYIKNGYIKLNKAKTGSLGNTTLFWTLENCKNEALKYHTRKEFQKNASGAWSAACRNNWLNICCKHMHIRFKTITLEDCIEDASKYNTKIEWCKSSNALYNRACRNNWIEQCCKHMKPYFTILTLEDCIEDALKYTTKISWVENSRSIYDKARKNKDWYEQCTSHMVRKPRIIRTTLKDFIIDASKYNTKTEWFKNSKNMYQKALRNKEWFTQCTTHMVRKPRII